VLVLSRGGNNDFPAAVSLYERFLQQFEVLQVGKLLRGLSPIAVGVIWPSIWLPSDDGPQIDADPASARDPAPHERVLAALRAALPQSIKYARLYELLDADKLSFEEARELAGLIKPALRASSDGAEEAGASEESILRTLLDLQSAFGTGGAALDWDRFGTVQSCRTSEDEQPEAAGLLQYLDPRWAPRLASLYIMKDRAGAALGGYGPRGGGEHLVDPIPAPGTAVAVPDGVRLVGLA
jgi:hypothetical protein